MPNTGAVVLAAGESSRFGRPKQLVQFRGKSFVRRIVDLASEAGCDPIILVLGSDAEKVTVELNQTRAAIVDNKNWKSGIGSSIRAGVQRSIDQTRDVEAIVLLTCDQPFVDATTIRQLIALREESKKAIVASSYSGTLGVPALFDRSCFQELLTLDDDSGAKPVILRNRARVAEFSFPAGKIDIDTLEDYQSLVAQA